MFDDDNFIKRHPFLITGIILVYISIPVISSIPQWFEHPKKIACTSLTNTCTLKEYAYKREICWIELVRGRHSSRHYYCKLPKFQTSVVNLLPLSEIKDVIVKNEPSGFRVYLKSIKDSEVQIAVFDKYSDATYLSSNLKAHIKKWQEQSEVSNSESDESFSYNFVE